MPLGSPKVALAVSGSIAAYKAVEVARRLLAEGIAVVPVMTASATKFLAPLTLSGICGTPVVVDMFDEAYPGEVHVDLGKSVELVVVAPATADTLARLAHGRADDIVTALALSAGCPILVAPAMHSRMWNHPATQRNVDAARRWSRLFRRSVGAPSRRARNRADVGPNNRLAALLQLAQTGIAGLRIVVTAGPTVGHRPVRFVPNRSAVV
jgi:phosphopantothenoylcysteine decarboxylase/phosphopantothenate--cysteine ligase